MGCEVQLAAHLYIGYGTLDVCPENKISNVSGKFFYQVKSSQSSQV